MWLPCRIVLRAGRASLLLALGASLEPGARLTLLLKHRSGVVYQVAGVAARPRRGYAEVRMPRDATLSLAELAGGRAEYSYAAKIKGLSLPLAELVYEGYMPYSLYAVAKGKAFAVMRKALDAPSGLYYVEFPHSLAAPLKYSRYIREDKRAGGDSGMFYIPQDVTLFLREWGVFEPGAEAGYVYVRVWIPSSTPQP